MSFVAADLHCCFIDPVTGDRCGLPVTFHVKSEIEPFDIYYHTCNQHLVDFMSDGVNHVTPINETL